MARRGLVYFDAPLARRGLGPIDAQSDLTPAPPQLARPTALSQPAAKRIIPYIKTALSVQSSDRASYVDFAQYLDDRLPRFFSAIADFSNPPSPSTDEALQQHSPEVVIDEASPFCGTSAAVDEASSFPGATAAVDEASPGAAAAGATVRMDLEQTYELGKTLGRGKFGTVKEAVHRQTGQRVAIKIINKTLVNHTDDVELVGEVRLKRLSIDHPNVQRVLDVVDTRDTLCIVLDLAAGGDLYDYIASQGKLSENSARKMFKQLIHGLEACHAAGVVHRDIKPENLLLRKMSTSDEFAESHDSIILSDFGLSNLFKVDANASESLLQTPCGTLNYLAPELMTGTAYKPTAIDVWSVAVVLFVAVEGRFPFSEPTDSCEQYRTLQNNAFEFPGGFGQNLTILLAGMFCIDPKTRWTLSQIKSSEWWNESEIAPKPRQLLH